jgi:sugar lactone lactonase YvrE
VIDMANKKIEKKIPIEGAQMLNDVTVSDKGVVYVSDSKTGRIWRIEKDKPALFLENMQGVNGLKAVKNDLIIASGKTFVKADAQKKLTTITELPQGGDGIEPVGNGDYLVSAWSGYIFYVSKEGNTETLLETHEQKINSADIGYDPVKKIVYVPTFFAKTVSAYQLD